MRNKLAKRPLRRLRLVVVAAVLLLLLAAILAAPFVLTLRLANIALEQFFPAYRPSVGSATLSLSGALVLHDLMLHDTGALARQPLITAREMDAVFCWKELLSRRIRRLRAVNVILYARSNGASQLSLLDLLFGLSKLRSAAGSQPLWIGALEVQGFVHREFIKGFAAANSDLPLALQTRMSGDHADPSRHFLVSIGETPQLIAQIPENSHAVAPARRNSAAFGLRAEIDTQPAAAGTRVVVHSLSASQANITIEADALRQFVAKLPEQIQGSIETGVAKLWASGELDPPDRANGKRLSGRLVFAGLRVHLPGGSRMKVGLDDLTGSARFDTPLPPGPGTAITIERLQARNASASMEADTLRSHVAILPRELQGRIESSIGNLSASGKLDPRRPSNHTRLAGSLAFSGLHVRIAGGSQMTLDLGNAEGAASIDTNLPPVNGTAITIRRLQAKNASASIEADILRGYTRTMLAGSQGRLAATLETLDASGMINPTARHPMLLNGNIRLQNVNAHSSVDGKGALSVSHLTVAGSVDSRLDRWEPETFKVRDGTAQWSELSYVADEVNDLDAFWHVDGKILTIDRLAAQVFGGQISGASRLDLLTLAVPPCDFQIKRIDVHKALANISPEHLDADGTASGLLHLTVSNARELSGYGDLAFDGPGILRVDKIAEIERLLVGSFGADMASLAMHDLERYPFKEGSLHLESMGTNSLLKVKFIRQPRTAADKMPPRKEMINGKEVWVGSLVVPKIDMTIPITGKSFTETLSMVSGFRPLIRTDSHQPRK